MTPTFEEYKNWVRDHMMFYVGPESDFKTENELDEYLSMSDVMEEMRLNYLRKVKKYQDGKISLNVLREGVAGALAWCLWMLYDGSQNEQEKMNVKH